MSSVVPKGYTDCNPVPKTTENSFEQDNHL